MNSLLMPARIEAPRHWQARVLWSNGKNLNQICAVLGISRYRAHAHLRSSEKAVLKSEAKGVPYPPMPSSAWLL